MEEGRNGKNAASVWKDSLTDFLTQESVIPMDKLLLSTGTEDGSTGKKNEVKEAAGDFQKPKVFAPDKITVPLGVRHRVLWGDPGTKRPGRMMPRGHALSREPAQLVPGPMMPNHTFLAMFPDHPETGGTGPAGGATTPSAGPAHGSEGEHRPKPRKEGTADDLPGPRKKPVMMFPVTMTEDEAVHTARQAFHEWRRRGGSLDTVTGRAEFDGVYQGVRVRGVIDETGTILDFEPHEAQVHPVTGRLLQAPLHRSELPAPLPYHMPHITRTMEKFVLYGHPATALGAFHSFNGTTPLLKGTRYTHGDPSEANQNGTVHAKVEFLERTVRPSTAARDDKRWKPAMDTEDGRHLLFPRNWTAGMLWRAVQEAHAHALDSGRFRWPTGAYEWLGAGYLWTGESQGVRVQGYTLGEKHIWVLPAQAQPRLHWEAPEEVRARTKPEFWKIPVGDGQGTRKFNISHVVLDDGDIALHFTVDLPVPSGLTYGQEKMVDEKLAEIQKRIDQTYNMLNRGDGDPLMRFDIVKIHEPRGLDPEQKEVFKDFCMQEKPAGAAQQLLGFAPTREDVKRLLAEAGKKLVMPSHEEPEKWAPGADMEAVLDALISRLPESMGTQEDNPLLAAYRAADLAPHLTRHDTVRNLLAQRRHVFSDAAWDKESPRKTCRTASPPMRLACWPSKRPGGAWTAAGPSTTSGARCRATTAG